MLVASSAGLALLLAAIGLFGMFAYAVQQRVRDFGVRRALGATTGDVLRPVVLSAFRVIGAGAILGLVLSIALSRFLSAMLFGVQPLDPVTFALVPIALALTGVAAIAGPAWRATRVDPATALRGE
jgi:ABC-type antimicrobial peptide transport system permease subunit